jgi:hypothetical protein
VRAGEEVKEEELVEEEEEEEAEKVEDTYDGKAETRARHSAKD